MTVCAEPKCRAESYGAGACWPHLRDRLRRLRGWPKCQTCGAPAIEADPMLGGALEYCAECVEPLKAADVSADGD